jgi:hypothetical protein
MYFIEHTGSWVDKEFWNMEEFKNLPEDTELVQYFLQLFVKPEHFYGVLIINEPRLLSNPGEYGFKDGEKFMFWRDISQVNQEAVIRTSTSHGGLGVFFIAKENSNIIQEYLSLGYYYEKEGLIQRRGEGFMQEFSGLEYPDYVKALLNITDSKQNPICSFSHDAQCFMEIKLEKEDFEICHK